ncbi:hypothetical protein KNV79_gp38 [Salmonella phage vB_SalP_TR2]|uniref:Uncharacterized protein n=1 Tax=Salmonella phage vB_SalP_TR2 TaxID=2812854 RepID=A0A898KAN7_9CAUD|nr:hypothetical protein KNV79_gp38 [Salmonella phage vB_SalP_TR2]QSJ04014.1 hypothetical protein [Salmonella phage vB_SalP_TR2]
MNHDLITILIHLKSHTFMNSKLCHFIFIRDICRGNGCEYCLLNSCSITSDLYVSRLLFRIPI